MQRAWTAVLLAAVLGLSSATPVPAPASRWSRGRPRLGGRIVGGHDVDISQYPWQLFMDTGCGATIISSTWALSAAHCIVESSPIKPNLRAGSSSRGSGGSVHAVLAVHSHENYDYNSFDYDITVLQVADPFVFSDKVQVVALATSEPAAGTTVTTSGWGVTESFDYPEQLQAVDLQIVDRLTCNATYGIITERMICAGVDGGGKDSCGGDSGGPLVQGSTQVGIVSWGNGCGLANYPGVYTNVANMRSWIQAASGV